MRRHRGKAVFRAAGQVAHGGLTNPLPSVTMHTMESIARAVLVHAEGPKGVAVRPVDRRAGQDKEEGEWQFY